MLDRGFFLTWQAVRRQLAAMRSDLYLVRLIHHPTRRPIPGERLWTAMQLLQPPTIRFLRFHNREGCDVYIRACDEDLNAGYILLDLDGADAEVLNRMRRDGNRPCVALETSPGHLQAWVRVSTSSLEPYLATAIAQRLARGYGADPASASWCHLGRLAGFTNRKPSRRTAGQAPWVKVVYASAGVAPNADDLLRNSFLPGPAKFACIPASPSSARRSHFGTDSMAADAATIYGECVERWHIPERFPQPDWNIVDLWVARRLLSQGMRPLEVENVLRFGSPQFPRRHGDPGEYLRRTLARAAFTAAARRAHPV